MPIGHILRGECVQSHSESLQWGNAAIQFPLLKKIVPISVGEFNYKIKKMCVHLLLSPIYRYRERSVKRVPIGTQNGRDSISKVYYHDHFEYRKAASMENPLQYHNFSVGGKDNLTNLPNFVKSLIAFQFYINFIYIQVR